MTFSGRPGLIYTPNTNAIYQIFGTSLVEYFDPAAAILNSGTVSSLRGGFAGVPLHSPAWGTRPAFSASSASFNGKPTFTTDRTSAASLVSTGYDTEVRSKLGMAGDNVDFFVSLVAKQLDASPNVNYTGVILATDLNSHRAWLCTQRTQSSSSFMFRVNTSLNTGFIAAGTTAVQAPHVLMGWADVANLKVWYQADGDSPASGSYTGTLLGNLARVGLGSGTNSDVATRGNYEIAFALVAKNTTANMRSAWRTYCTTTWGTP